MAHTTGVNLMSSKVEDLEFVLNTDLQALSVSAYRKGLGGTASASLCRGVWWIDRVVVSPKLHRKGLGTLLLKKLSEMVASTDVHTLKVCPGGYEGQITYAGQCAFYESCGFEHVVDGIFIKLITKKELLNERPATLNSRH